MENELEESVKILKNYFSREEERLKEREQEIKSCLDLLNHLEQKLLQDKEKPEILPKEAKSWPIAVLEIFTQFV